MLLSLGGRRLERRVFDLGREFQGLEFCGEAFVDCCY